jgi:type IV fimbrial biogenesis protein FimT
MAALGHESARRRAANGERGFTLIEALIVIVLAAILLSLAAPSFINFTAGQRVKTASFDLYAALALARSEAIKRRQTVTVAPQTGTDWATGWTVKVGGTTLRVQDPLKGVAFSGATSVAYRLDGRLSAGSTLGVLIKPASVNPSVKNRCIRIDLTGLPKSTTTSGTTCP